MTDWKYDYSQKVTSKEEAISQIKSGDTIVFGHAAGEPTTLVDELVRQKDRFRDVKIIHMVPLGESKYCLPEMKENFRHISLFAGATTRKAIREERADYTPVFFSEIPRLFRDRIIPIDIALIQLSPPNKDGDMSFGVSVDYTLQASKSARLVIAEVNKQMPRTMGKTIHFSQVDFIVETDRPLHELDPPIITEIEEKIGRNIASLVPNNANLQLGIGAIPDAALKFLPDKRDLGIHSEMFSDGVVDLYEKGIITNKYNNLNPGKFTATFLMGTKKLYQFVDNNPDVEMYPVDYTNNVMNAGKVQNLISINSALQVDLFGQVCADTLGYQQFSGVGGQVDFVRASSLSPGGKSIIALPSTNKTGTVSRIVAKFYDGSCVTTSRNDVHYVVTEYGIANLRGKTICERAKKLIEIAHPSFRDQLKKEFCELSGYKID
ncbi:MAG: acetyl-CoA hydrolase/transferase family protein [Candidatus Lokiarchaeota archaeon]|nr:acetyl-CoA hydrolase/transferase family protein [Candidatus Lokiarchaeota archaeon]